MRGLTRVIASLLGLALVTILGTTVVDAKGVKRVWITSPDRVMTPYQRPTQTTRAQRNAVQGAPCVTCGASAPRMHADHKQPLIHQHHRGPVDVPAARRVEAVQPMCPSCSASQGGQLRAERQRLQTETRVNQERVKQGCPALAWIKSGGKC